MLENVDDDSSCPNTVTHFYEFKEYEKVINLIDQLPANSVDLRRRERALEQFKFICDAYQEQPHLIDPYLLTIFEKLIGVVKAAITVQYVSKLFALEVLKF